MGFGYTFFDVLENLFLKIIEVKTTKMSGLLYLLTIALFVHLSNGIKRPDS